MDGAGEHNDGTEKNENETKLNKEQEIEKNDDEERRDEDLTMWVVKPRPEPVVVDMKGADYKVVTLKRGRESFESDDVIIDATPINSYSPGTDIDLTQVEPALKKLKGWVEDNYLKPPPLTNDVEEERPDPNLIPTPTPTPTPTRERRPKIKIIRPTKPEPKLVLKRPRVTYIRPRSGPKPDHIDVDDPNNQLTSMGPPPPPAPGVYKTPYEIVKDTLTFMKSELGISAEDYAEMWESETAAAEEYSLARVTPDSLFSLDEVVLELDLFLNSMPETSSLDFIKQMLLAFQTRLEIPPHPHFYDLMKMSPANFMLYLDSAHELHNMGMEISDTDDSEESEDSEVDDDDVGTDGHGQPPHGGASGDDYKYVVELCGGESSTGVSGPRWDEDDDDDEEDVKKAKEEDSMSKYRAPFTNLPSPDLTFYDAIEILHEYIHRIENDDEYKLDETTFFNLQRDLDLPENCSLYLLYQREYNMDEVVEFIHNYFQTSTVYRVSED